MNLGERIEVFQFWASSYIEAGYHLKPRKPLKEFDFTQSSILTFKMMISFGLELMLKTYCLILLHKEKGEFEFENHDEFVEFMKKNKIWNHNLLNILNKIKEKDRDFDNKDIIEIIEFFNNFQEFRYPYTLNFDEKYNLFAWEESYMNGLEKTRTMLRGKINSYIRNNIW